MARIIAIANQKGGVGKTTTAVNLAASLAIAERRTLLIDADPQGNATSGIGLDKSAVGLSVYDVIIDRVSPADVVVRHDALPHLDVLPATQDLVGAELELVQTPRREHALHEALGAIHDRYDYVIVDCPPSLGLITLNVLTAAQGVIIPIQCEYYALEGISQLLNTVRLVQQNFNPTLAIDGVLLTMYDARLNLCRQVAEDAKEYFGQQMFRTAVPRNVRLAEAPSFGKPILLYDVQSVGARSYLAIAQELLRRTGGGPAEVEPAAHDAPPATVDADIPTEPVDETSQLPEPDATAEIPDVTGEVPVESAAAADAPSAEDAAALEDGDGADADQPPTGDDATVDSAPDETNAVAAGEEGDELVSPSVRQSVGPPDSSEVHA